jgi:hypothetical protein
MLNSASKSIFLFPIRFNLKGDPLTYRRIAPSCTPYPVKFVVISALLLYKIIPTVVPAAANMCVAAKKIIPTAEIDTNATLPSTRIR